MKFSVLIPTRNRLELLRYAVETVMRQDYDDWEIIIYDNFSEQDVAGYVKSLAEPRVRYYRTESFVPVTDNWNNALEKSTGDYVVMLGDDDCLLPGYFSTIDNLVRSYGDPDFIFTSGYLYAYPNVMPGNPDGFLQTHGNATFFRPDNGVFWLDKETALEAVRQSMNFRLTFDFNMQYSVISRKLIKSLEDKGKFFQSPYPDYYAHNVLFLKADRILVCQQPLVVVGISSKSFGYHYFNKDEKKGKEFLKNFPDAESARRLERIVLPGTDINTSWLFSMEAIKANYGHGSDLRVNYRRYRFLQILHVYLGHYVERNYAKESLKYLWKHMSLREKLAYGGYFWYIFKILSHFRQSQSEALKKLVLTTSPYPVFNIRRSRKNYKNIMEVFEQPDPLESAN